LETLDLDKNQFVIKDLSPLLELPNLKKLSVADCNIMDDTTIKKLKEKGVKVSQ
jgi:Leucine-rich repeat (LRR) protein